MLLSMAYPNIYLQEPGILKQSGNYIKKFGSNVFVIAGRRAWSKVKDQINESFEKCNINVTFSFFEGACTYEEVDRLQGKVSYQTDLIVAIGGGKCMDTAKLVAARLNLPIVTVATLASTCASTAPKSIMYTVDKTFCGVEEFDKCPILTMVDTEIIANAPVRYLIAGIGDTLAKWYEAYPINVGKYKTARTKLGLRIAELARDILFEFSENAIHENIEGVPGEALSQVIDANILLAGLVGGIGSYTCWGSGAHAIHNGLTCLKETHKSYHGEIVAFGILSQMMLEGKPLKEIEYLMSFYRLINLPISLYDLNVTVIDDQKLMAAAEIACGENQHINLLPFQVTKHKVFEAIKKVHELGENQV